MFIISKGYSYKFVSLDNQVFLSDPAKFPVIPAKAGICSSEPETAKRRWIPAFAGMTTKNSIIEYHDIRYVP